MLTLMSNWRKATCLLVVCCPRFLVLFCFCRSCCVSCWFNPREEFGGYNVLSVCFCFCFALFWPLSSRQGTPCHACLNVALSFYGGFHLILICRIYADFLPSTHATINHSGKSKKEKPKQKRKLTRLGLDPRTLSVLTIRDNQLHHPAVACSWELMAIYPTPI